MAMIRSASATIDDSAQTVGPIDVVRGDVVAFQAIGSGAGWTAGGFQLQGSIDDGATWPAADGQLAHDGLQIDTVEVAVSGKLRLVSDATFAGEAAALIRRVA